MMRVQHAAVCQRAARQRNPFTHDDTTATAARLRARRRFTPTPAGHARQLRFHHSVVQCVEQYHRFRWRARAYARAPQKRPRPAEFDAWPVAVHMYQYAQPYLQHATRGALPWYGACGVNADGEGYSLSY